MMMMYVEHVWAEAAELKTCYGGIQKFYSFPSSFSSFFFVEEDLGGSLLFPSPCFFNYSRINIMGDVIGSAPLC